MTTSVVQIQSDDFSEIEETWKRGGWDADYRQLGKGAFHGSLVCSAVGSSALYRGRWTNRIQHRGLQPQGTVTLAHTLELEGPQRFMGEPMGRDDLIVQTGNLDFDLVGAPHWDAAVVTIPESEVADQLADLTQEDPEAILSRRGLAPLAPETRSRLRSECLGYFGAVERSLASVHEAPALPEIAADLITRFVGALARSRRDPAPIPSLSRSHLIVRKAEDFAESCEDAWLRVPDVCREVGVSERSLRYAFQNVVGTSPAAYLKTQRLNRVRRRLRLLDPSSTIVKQVAYAHGFWHLGQFSRDYKALFGELPSETLGRAGG